MTRLLKHRKVWDLRHGCYTKPIHYQVMKRGKMSVMCAVLRDVGGKIRQMWTLGGVALW